MSIRAFVVVLSIGLSQLFSAVSNAGIIYDENIDGSFSTDNLLPTPLGTLPLGVSSVLGAIELSQSNGNVDVFSFEVAPGTKLTEMRILDYQSSDDIAVLAMNSGNSFPFGPSQFTSTLTTAQLQQIIGVAQFGPGWENTTGFSARDLLSSADSMLTPANLIGARVSGTKPFGPYGASDKFDELPGGATYTVYMQQQGANTQYQLDFTVVGVPEPSSLLLAGFFAIVAGTRRRRS